VLVESNNKLLVTIAGMPFRVIALLLAFVLLWSGLSTIESPRAVAPASLAQQHRLGTTTAHAGEQAATQEGSVEHHHLDDLPLQAQGDTPTETPALLPAQPASGTSALRMAQPLGFVAAESGPPFLAGPLRPPCGTALLG
jgi:hypothetical protein